MFVGQQGSGGHTLVGSQADTAVPAPAQVKYLISPSWASVDVVLFSYRSSKLNLSYSRFLMPPCGPVTVPRQNKVTICRCPR